MSVNTKECARGSRDQYAAHRVGGRGAGQPRLTKTF